MTLAATMRLPLTMALPFVVVHWHSTCRSGHCPNLDEGEEEKERQIGLAYMRSRMRNIDSVVSFTEITGKRKVPESEMLWGEGERERKKKKPIERKGVLYTHVDRH